MFGKSDKEKSICQLTDALKIKKENEMDRKPGSV